MDDLITIALVGGVLFFGYIGQMQLGKKIFAAGTRKEKIQGILTALGIKNFKPQDLNADKLDDTGFTRLVQLIQVTEGVGAQLNNPMAGIQAAVQQMQALGSMTGALGGLTPQKPTPPATTSQTPPVQ